MATITATPSTPPLKDWVPPSILSLISSAPTNPAIRGLIRNELHLVVPSDLKPTTKNYQNFLTENYKDSFQYKQGAGTRRYNINTPWDAIMPQTTAQVAPPPLIHLPDGSLRIEQLSLSGQERGRSAYRCTLSFTGALTIPRDVVAQGYDECCRWIRENTSSRHEELGIIFSSDNYEFRDHETQELPISINGGFTREFFNAAVPPPVTTQPAN